MSDPLAKLAMVWRARAVRKFHDAEREPDVMGRRLIEHGGFCYANCATELEETLRATGAAAPGANTPSTSETSTKPLS